MLSATPVQNKFFERLDLDSIFKSPLAPSFPKRGKTVFSPFVKGDQGGFLTYRVYIDILDSIFL